MSHGFMVWAVDIEKLEQVAGSRDDELRRVIGDRFEHDLARLDDLFSQQIDAGSPSSSEALRQIVDGTIPKKARGGIYAYAFKLLLEHLGEFLPNEHAYSWGFHDDSFDAVMREMGVPFTLASFMGHNLPVKLPRLKDLPLSGWLSADEVAHVDAAFATAKIPDHYKALEDVVQCVRGWFREAAATKRGLVAYYH